MRHRPAGLALALVALLCSCSQPPDDPAPRSHSDHPAPRPATPSSPAPANARANQPVTKLLVLAIENHSLEQMRTGMPYSYGLARRFGYATNFYAIRHPSLPNYIAIASGSTHGINEDKPPSAHPLTGSSVFGQAVEKGRTAGLYADGMPTNCSTIDGGGGYAARHNPWVYFTNERRMCQANDRPLTDLPAAVAHGNLPNAGMLVPNLCHDAHDCGLPVADAWIANQVGAILQGPDWRSGHLAVVITADEDDGESGNRILTVLVHPSQRHHVVSQRLTHYSLSRLYSEVLHAKPLGRGASSSPSMAKAFGLRVG